MNSFSKVFALAFLFSSLCFGNLAAQTIIDGPGKLLFDGDYGVNEHLHIVSTSELGENDVWQVEELDNGNVVIKCPTRGYLLAGAAHDNVFNLGYHQYASSATQFQTQERANGYKTYQWVNTNHNDRYLGGWRNIFILKKGSPSAGHLKID